MTETYQLEKARWTEADFEQMGWHDARIHALAFVEDGGPETRSLLLDIDYIFQWVPPVAPANHFTFWVAPCTLIFPEVTIDFIHIDDPQLVFEVEISDLNRLEQPSEIWGEKWQIQLQSGEMTFWARGYEQIVRRYPKHIHGQTLSLAERGGLSFDRTPCL